jgi:hypothetical protein
MIVPPLDDVATRELTPGHFMGAFTRRSGLTTYIAPELDQPLRQPEPVAGLVLDE